MMRLSLRLLGVSPFTLFMMDHKNDPALKGFAISKRASMLSKMYKELSQNQRRELNKRAASHPTLPKRSREQRLHDRKVSLSRKRGGFAQFVKAHYDQVRRLNYRKRFAALSKLYDVMRPIDLDEVTRALPLIEKLGRNKPGRKAKEQSLP
ncbi:hypothetical protein ERJ75_000042500 [Trypanosoma vivax]|nr:hypothetical protein ERJ75_000042500 [Trypanosoma vivax]